MTFVPVRDAVIISRAKPELLRQRAHRLKLTAACDVRTKQVIYSLPDLVDLERTTRERAERRESLNSAA